MARYMETIRVAIPEACKGDCCEIVIDCPTCVSVPSTYIFVLSGTGDLAFLDGQTVTVTYAGLSGGFYNFTGSAVIDGWTVTVGWGIPNDTICSFVSGNIQLFKSGECSNITQEMDDPAATTSLTTCDPAVFTIDTEQLFNNGEPAEGQCFTGTVGGVGTEV